MQIRNTYFAYLLVTSAILTFLITPFSIAFADSEFQGTSSASLILSSDKQFNYAQDLFSAEDYLTAVNEYKRFIYFFPKDKRVELAMYRIGMSYYLSQHYQEAVDAFRKLTEQYVETEYSIKSYYKISEAFINLKAFDQALIDLNNLVAVTHDEDVRDEAYYRIGWIYIETASWDEARRYFNKISSKNRNKYKLQKLSAELDKETAIPRKNPKLAGVLSIVPGAGYIYCERYQDALISFLLNGGLIYAAYESFDKGHDGLGGLLSFVGFGFYAGNIYGAVSSAHKYNQRATGQFIYKLIKNARVNLSADLENKGVFLSFRLSF